MAGSAASRPQASGGVRARSSAAAMTAGASASKIQLYSLATPNGMKAGIALEEMGLEYDAHRIDITKGEQLTPEFLAINPNGKIPAIVDLDGPGGKPYNVFESGAILMYLAEKTGKFLPEDPALRWETIQWLFFQVGGVGPMFGQFGHFYKYAKDKCQDPYPVTRYTTEAKRLLGAGYGAAEHLELEGSFPRVMAWKRRCAERPLTAKGMTVCKM
eukprot:jgi/Mesen1/8809/ME000053S08213